MSPSTSRELLPLLQEAVEELLSACARFRRGEVSAYLTVAVQLRKMLTDSHPSAGPLLTRVIPDATFEALAPPYARAEWGEQTFWGADFRGAIGLRSGGPPQLDLMVQSDVLVPPTDWLSDWIVTPDIRIGALIREVGNKDGAHADNDAGPIMTALDEQLRSSSPRGPIDMRKIVIAGIGQYVLYRVLTLMGVPNLPPRDAPPPIPPHLL